MKKACDLLEDGKTEMAVDICFEMLEQPDVGYYRRATANLLVARFGNPDELVLLYFATTAATLLKRVRDMGFPAEEEEALALMEGRVEETIAELTNMMDQQELEGDYIDKSDVKMETETGEATKPIDTAPEESGTEASSSTTEAKVQRR
jgi:hypothetical protein